MALNQLSPGVNVREIDLTNFIPNVGTSGGAFVGQFTWGPVLDYTNISDSNRLAKVFGKPTESNYVDWYSVSNFLSYTNSCNVIRVTHNAAGVETAFNAVSKSLSLSGVANDVTINNDASFAANYGVSASYVGKNFAAKYPGQIGNTLEVVVVDGATYGDMALALRNLFDAAPGTSEYAASLGGADDEVHVVVIDKGGLITGIPGSVLEKYAFLSKASDAKGLDGTPMFYGNVINKNSLYIRYLGSDFTKPTLSGFPTASVAVDTSLGGTGYVAGGAGVGDVVAFTGPVGGGTTATGRVTAVDGSGKITGVTLVTSGTGYDEAQSLVATGVTPFNGRPGASVTVTGGTAGGVDYVAGGVGVGDKVTFTSPTGVSGTAAVGRVTAVDVNGAITAVTLVTVGSAYIAGQALVATSITKFDDTASAGSGADLSKILLVLAPVGSGANLAKITLVLDTSVASYIWDPMLIPGYSAASVSATTVGGSGYHVGNVIEFTAPTSGKAATARVTSVTSGGAITGVALVKRGSGYTVGQTVVATAIKTATGAAAGASDATLTNIVVTLSASCNWDTPVLNVSSGAPSIYNTLDSKFQQGFEGGDDGGALDVGDLQTGWAMFKNSEEVDVSILFVGAAGGDGTMTSVVNYVIGEIVESRKDCMVFFSPKRGDVVDQSQETASENVIATRNAVNFSSSYAAMDSGWKLQYDVFGDKYRWIPLNADVAGLCAATDTAFDPWWSPAGFTRGKIKNTVAIAFNPNKSLRDDLYKNNVNPVVSFKGDGVVLYGDKTLQAKASAFQYINVRRLFLVLEKAIAKASQYQLFEFNDQFTRAQFRNMVEPYLREVKGRRGLYDFKVVCDESNNTPEIIDRAEFVASIFLKPARSINFITLNFVAVRTGVEFSEIAGV